MFGFSKSKPEKVGFWDWLGANTNRIQTAIKSEVAKNTQEIQVAFEREFPGLVWEITPSRGGPWVFCVSADGLSEHFQKVEDAVNAAPAIRGWVVRAFRPRGSMNAVLNMGSRTLTYDDIWCRVKALEGGVSVILLIKGLAAENEKELSGAAAILLDNAIGERDAITKVKNLDRRPLPANPVRQADLFPLRDLPQFLDSM